MEDEQLRKIAQLLVKGVIGKAIDQINTEKKEMDEILDLGVDDIVGQTIGRSISAIRDGQYSPTDPKMKGYVGEFETEIEDIVNQTIGRSISAIRDGQSSPADEIHKRKKALVIATPEVTTGSTGSETPETEKDNNLTSLEEEQATAHQTSNTSGNKASIDKTSGGKTSTDKIPSGKKTSADKTAGGKISVGKTSARKTSGKKNILERLLDRVLKRDKKEANGIGAATDGGSTNTSVSRKKESSPKAHNKRDWIRRNLLCCFVRQTATVEPIPD